MLIRPHDISDDFLDEDGALRAEAAAMAAAANFVYRASSLI